MSQKTERTQLKNDGIVSITRWLNITLRTIHLIGVAGIGGAFLYHAPKSAWGFYLVLLVISGFGMLILDFWSNHRCLLQVRGISTIVKLFVLMLAMVVGLETYILITVIIISGVVAHAPGKVRYFYLL